MFTLSIYYAQIDNSEGKKKKKKKRNKTNKGEALGYG